nr:MAG TPA: hypothetical protein [Caudoviricetes sp.]
MLIQYLPNSTLGFPIFQRGLDHIIIKCTVTAHPIASTLLSLLYSFIHIRISLILYFR